MSKILCIIDGMTDSSFCASDYPNLSSMRLLHYVDTTKGQEPESLGCILRLLGVKKIPEHLRGFVEALGNDIPVGANDLVLRGSWFGLDEQGRCTVPVAAPDNLPPIENCHYYALEQYKSILVIPAMASFVTDMVTYPPYGCSGLPAEQMRPKGCKRVGEIFDSLKSDQRCLIPWGQAVSSDLRPFPQKAAVVCGCSIVKGIARLLGMEVISVSGATGDTDTDLMEKGKAALLAAKTNPFVLLHINGADEAAHRKDPQEKKAFLQKVDDIILTMLLSAYHEVYVVADHGTDPLTGKHLSGKQPMYTNVPDVTARKPDHTKQKSKNSELIQRQQKNWAIEKLQSKAEELGRAPIKTDFTEIEKIKIKHLLGPWPRALEEAGLKERKIKKRR